MAVGSSMPYEPEDRFGAHFEVREQQVVTTGDWTRDDIREEVR